MGGGQPDQNLGQEAHFQGRESRCQKAFARARSLQPAGQPPRAEIVCTALQHHRPHGRLFFVAGGQAGRLQNSRHAGELLVKKLVLEGNRIGGDHDAAVISPGPCGSWQEVGQTFADTGTCLDDLVIAAVQRVQH